MALDDLLSWLAPASPDADLVRRLDFDRLPAHVAIIMDGNGRWAGRRHLPRVEGHRAGTRAVREVIETAARLGLGHITLYAFSVENWKRPAAEVATLMALLKRYVRSELKTLLSNNIRLCVIGRIHDLPADVQHELAVAMERTQHNTGTVLSIALNYGGRAEIVDAIRAALAQGLRPEDIDEARVADLLYTRGQPDPDLLIRTSGELRISNFLLWQIAYAEIYVTDTFWPDFRRTHLFEALLDFQKRERRYGGVTTASSRPAAASR
ncbi:MAG: isoprenyl transferase [Acidobacteria bacterium]|nr:isoprenyl transferase [Acidobacteriota bacterium]